MRAPHAPLSSCVPGNFKVAAVAPATQSRRNNIQLDCYWLLEQRDPRAASDYTTEYTTRF